jgi:hypothetical protein
MVLAASAAQASTVTVDLGPSAQNFVETGLGPSSGVGGTYANWSLTQGACVTSAVLTTCTLSGAIASGTTGFSSGSYSLVTKYATTTPATPPDGIGYAAGPTSVLLSNYFGYDFLSPTTDMVLTLTTSSGPTVVNLVTNGSIVDPNFSFASTGTPVCTGVTQCDPYDVGITKGATFSSLDTINVSFNVPTTVPLPAALWLMLSGIGGLAALARKRKTAV